MEDIKAIKKNTVEIALVSPIAVPKEQTTVRLGRDFFYVTGLMLFSTLISIFFLFQQSLRLDEAQSLWQTSRSPQMLLQIVGKDVHVPLYHMLLHFWQLFFGTDVSVARILSLIFFMLTIPAVYYLGKEAYGRRIALFAAVLVSVSPFLSWYGSEIRMYSLLVFLTVINQIFFLRIFKNNTPGNWIGYAITAILGIYTHYFFFFGLAAQAIFFLYQRKEFPKKSLRNFIITGTVLFLTFLPWLYYVGKLGFAASTKPLIDAPTSINLFNTFAQFIFGFQGDHLNTILVSLWPITMLLAIFALRRDRRAGERRKIPIYTKYFLFASILPILMVFIISFVRPIYVSRYLIFTAPALYLFLGWMFSTYTPRLGKVARAFLILIMLVTFGHQTISATTPVKEDYRAAVDYLSQKSTAQDIIIVSAPFTIYPIEYYYHGPSEIQTLPIWDRYAGGLPVFDAKKLPDEVEQLKENHQVAWLLLSYDQGYNRRIKEYMDSNFQTVEKVNFSPGLDLYGYKLRY